MSRNQAFLTFERDAHDRIAATYHAAFTPVTARAHGPLLEAGTVRSGSRVLDVATGPGVLAGRAAARGAVVTGIDLSERMVALAATLHPDVRFRSANAEELPFADASFEVVLSGFGIGHFAEPDRAFAEFRRVLASGGRLAVAWWGPPSASRLNGLFFDALQDEGIAAPASLPAGPSTFQFSDPQVLHAALTRAGFGGIVTDRHEGTHNLPDVEALWTLARGSFARLGTIIEGLDEAERQRFKAAVAARASAYGTGALAVPVAFDVTTAVRPA